MPEYTKYLSTQEHIDETISYLRTLKVSKKYMVTIKPFKMNKTRAMENTFHGLIRRIASKTGMDFEQVLYLAKVHYFGEHEVWLPVTSGRADDGLDGIRNSVKKLLRHAKGTMKKSEMRDAVAVISALVDRAFGKKTDADGNNFRVYRYTGSTSKLKVDEYQALIMSTQAWAAMELQVTV